MAKRGAGVISRPIPSWCPREMYGGRAQQSGVAGNITYVELYNSSATGGLIYVWGVNIGGAANDEYVPEWYYGKHQTNTQPGASAPLWSGGPAGYGVLGGWNNSTCIGVEIGDFLVAAGQHMTWPHDFPIAFITPGYSFAIHSVPQNDNTDLGIWWQESPEY